MFENKKLKGLIAAPFTPFDKVGEIRPMAIDKYATYLIEKGVSGVFICGTTGEAASMTTEERKIIASEWMKMSRGKLKVIVHVGGTSVPQSIELVKHAKEIGAYAVAAIAPYFFKPANAQELVDFFVPIATASDLPFYYYHMPSITGVSISVEDFLIQGKKHIPNLAGVKFTHNNLMVMQQCLHLYDGEFDVLHGFDEILLAGLALGVKGGVGSTYNYIAPLYLDIIKAVNDGNFTLACQLQMKSVEIVKIIIRHGGGVRGGKGIMNLLGFDLGECRRPITPFTSEEYLILETELKSVDVFQTINASV
jgi:N-acetylneuraminate lyase